MYMNGFERLKQCTTLLFYYKIWNVVKVKIFKKVPNTRIKLKI